MHRLASNTVSISKSKMQHPVKRTSEEYILLTLCAAGIVGVLPFVVFRVVQSQWLTAAIETTIILGVILIGIYVWKRRKVRLPSILLTVFYLCGVAAVININGPSLIYWAFPAMTASYFLLKPNEAAIANVLVMSSLLPVISVATGNLELSSIMVTLILNNIFSFIFSRNMQSHQDVLATQATRDCLTGAGNRRLFDENVSDSIAYLKRNNETTTMIMLDIDHFKKINDTFGHVMGDEVLVELSRQLNLRLRETDGLYRIGGEEFAILVRGTDAEASLNLAEELRNLIESKIRVPGSTITISLGVAECDVLDTNKSWQERADSALYNAKNTGRNRTCLEQCKEQLKEAVAKEICYH